MNKENSCAVFTVLSRLASIQREAIDPLALQDAIARAEPKAELKAKLLSVCQTMRLNAPVFSESPSQSSLPALLVRTGDGKHTWGVLRGQNGSGLWLVEWYDEQGRQWTEEALSLQADALIVSLRFRPVQHAANSAVMQLLKTEIFLQKPLLLESLVGGLLITFLGVLMSFYSLQVYDRVIPTGAHQTLIVLSAGMVIVLLLELMCRRLRSRLNEKLIERLDKQLSHAVYQRFLAVRLDQMPQGVGTVASQLRGYETVRGFMLGLTGYMTVDLPFAFLLMAVMAMIEPMLILVPFAAACLAVCVAVSQATKIQILSSKNHDVANRKTGLLVESIEGAEVIKSARGNWRMLNRWNSSADESRDLDLSIKRHLEFSVHWNLLIQQSAFMALLAWGSILVTSGQLTLGGLLACTILAGRVINPFVGLSQQWVAWAQARAALSGLDAIWRLQGDHHGVEQPLSVDHVKGQYRLKNIEMFLGERVALRVPSLVIEAGSRLGVLGPVGAGKSTLMKLLAGLYKPAQGDILLDDVDLGVLSRASLAEHIGYLPQDGRLLAGTLRENLTLGLIDPGDEALTNAARLTGLYDAVIAPHPHGLEQIILEGGTGLSGGQRQLVNLTRVFLRKPSVWLLDEPTSNLDRRAETQVIRALISTLKATDTLILITHKPELLQLVSRLLVMGDQQLVMEGEKSDVLYRLQQAQPAQELNHV